MISPAAPVCGPDSTAALARFQHELRSFIARRVPGPDADDVLQDTMLRIHLGVGSLRSQERLAPWVYRVARSAVIDHHRKHVPRPVDVTELMEEPFEEEPTGEVERMLSRCVAPFVDLLPSDQAEALRLTDLGGMTQAEAAARLGVPVPTLKARVQRGRRKLRDSFEACCELIQDVRGAVIDATPRCGC